MRGITTYLQEAFNELVHKVSWPSWKDLQSSGLVVMIASLIIAVIVLIMDKAFSNIVGIIYRMFF